VKNIIRFGISGEQTVNTASTNKFGGIGDEAVRKATGEDWAHWLGILDQAGAKIMDHKQIVACLQEHAPDMDGWWLQMITVGYEQARGLRQKYEKPGGFEVSRSKTISVPVSKAYQAWKDGRTRKQWLGDEKIDIRKSTGDRSMRVGWSDGVTSLDVNFYPKGDKKCQVTVQHTKLKSAREAEQKKKYWAERLYRLKEMLEA